MIKFLINSVLEKMINQVMKLDPAVLHYLTEYQGEVLAIEIDDLNLQFFILLNSENVYLYQRFEGSPTATIKGSSFALLKQLYSNSSDTQGLHVEGDLGLAQDFKKTLQNLHIDWEEYLALFTGDVIAHQVCLFLQKIFTTQKRIIETLRMDLTEFLQEEKNMLPTQTETQDLFEDISKFRNDVERLEAKYLRITS